MRKTILSISIILFCIIMLTACSSSSSLCRSSNSYTIYKLSEFRTDNSVRVKYENFNGKFYEPLGNKLIEVYDDETCTVKFNVVTESGKLDVSIEDEDGDVLYSKTEIPTSNFEFTIDKGGEYTVYFKGENHKGSCKLVWDYEKSTK